jgi:hypothetical protein
VVEMRQKKYPCCKVSISEDDIWNAMDGNDTGTTNKLIQCPNCGKNLTVFLNLDSIEEE